MSLGLHIRATQIMKEGSLGRQEEGWTWCLARRVIVLLSVVCYASSETSNAGSKRAVPGKKSSHSAFTPAGNESYAPFPIPDFWNNPFAENTAKDVSLSEGDTASKQQPFITFSLFFMGNLKIGYGSSKSQIRGSFHFCT